MQLPTTDDCRLHNASSSSSSINEDDLKSEDDLINEDDLDLESEDNLKMKMTKKTKTT